MTVVLLRELRKTVTCPFKLRYASFEFTDVDVRLDLKDFGYEVNLFGSICHMSSLLSMGKKVNQLLF